MMTEIDISGVFFSPLLLCMLVALATRVLLSRVLERVGFYQLVWHRPLFDISLFFLFTGASFEMLKIFTAVH
ncbi:DUF1656 domain-containing protein [Coraliomargarita parva]|uniref:DUF1656 domain-containing protein n=1 Tax=Coraliomargarita parva TaxID=3014050 RepID=UPI0022B42011|nr:DUF1656 domain-containing protein [Coraliomargarita parva]